MSNYFQNKKILVTGHTGFKGTWLCLCLLELGADIAGYALEPETKPNLFEVLEIQKQIRSYIADIRDYKKLSQVIQIEKPEIIFHMAAQPLVRRSYKEPRETFETNVMGTVNLFEAVRHCDSVRTVINITTDKVYENNNLHQAFKETDRLGGYDPYSSSKACSELSSIAYRNSFFNPADYGSSHQVAVATARAGNVVGGGDWSEDRLIPDCIRSLQANKSIEIRNPIATRPWQHVLEPLTGYLKLAEKLAQDPVTYSQAWNFGPKEDAAITVRELVEKLIFNWGSGSYQLDKANHVHEATFLELDTSKAEQELKFKPKLTIDGTIKLTIDWYKEFNQNPQGIKEFTLKQIRAYKKVRFINLNNHSNNKIES